MHRRISHGFVAVNVRLIDLIILIHFVFVKFGGRRPNMVRHLLEHGRRMHVADGRKYWDLIQNVVVVVANITSIQMLPAVYVALLILP